MNKALWLASLLRPKAGGTPPPPLTPFHQAVVAAGFSNFYDGTLYTGGALVNYGTAGSAQNATVTGGTPQAGGILLASIDQSIDLPAQTFTSGTFCLLVTPQGTLDGTILAMLSNISGSCFVGKSSYGLEASFESFDPAISAYAAIDASPFVSGEKILLVGRYNASSGVPELRYAGSNTIIAPSLDHYFPQAAGGNIGEHSFIVGSNLGADGTLVEAVFYHTDYLSDTVLQDIVDAIVWS